MENPFLKDVAQRVYQQFGAKMTDVYVVLPSRRACMYFKYYLTQLIDAPIIAPYIFSMADFAQHLGKVNSADNITLIFELYQVYSEFDKNDISLEEFIPIGSAILKDFSTLDNNISEKKAKELFEYLHEAKAIERWAEDNLGQEITQKKAGVSLQEYFDFWTVINAVFFEFRKRLLDKNMAYNGLAFRKIMDNIEHFLPEMEQVVFAGFSQVSGVEKELMTTFHKHQKAIFYWDSDKYYFGELGEDEIHEAGDYLRHLCRVLKIKQSFFQQQQIGAQPLGIKVIAASGSVEQVKVAGFLLGQIIEEALGQMSHHQLASRTNYAAVLLPDEVLLTPLLHSLPELQNFSFAEQTNITVGMALHRLPIYDLVESIFRLQESLKLVEGKAAFYYQDLINLMGHLYIKQNPDFQSIVEGIKTEIFRNNMVYIFEEKLKEWVGDSKFLQTIFSDWQGDYRKGLRFLDAMCLELSTLFSAEQVIENEIVVRFYGIVKRLSDVLGKQNEVISIRTLRRFSQEIMRSTSIPFTGEPIAPVQVMGMLESRSLDFEHIIIVSCNEGVLPKGKSFDSLIPFDIRRSFGLPTHQEYDGSFAYTFYRLFHKAKSVTLIYNTSPTESFVEKSRFIIQLETEMAHLPQVHIRHLTAKQPMPQGKQEAIRLTKTTEIAQRIENQLKKGLSPSAINLYITNPLEFFMGYVLKAQQVEQVEETLDVRTFGTLLHGGLEEILKGYHGKWIEKHQLQKISEDKTFILNKIQESLAKNEELKGIELAQGKNYIFREMAIRMISDYLKKEERFFIVSIESYFDKKGEKLGEMLVKMPDGRQVPFRLAGKADRVDIYEKEGKKIIRVVDYKTGTFADSDLKAAGRKDLFSGKKGKVIQLMSYKYLLIKALLVGKPDGFIFPPDFSLDTYLVESGFYFFRVLDKGFRLYSLDASSKEKNEDIDEEILSKKYEKHLLAVEPDNVYDFVKYVEEFYSVLVQDMLDTKKDLSIEPSDFQPYIDTLD